MSTKNGTFRLGGDLEVNRLGYGAMRLTGPGIWGEPKDPAEAKRVLKRAVELGVNFIDTADSYGPAVSERLIGEALSPFPQGLVVATKARLYPSGTRPVAGGGPAGISGTAGGDEFAMAEDRCDRLVATAPVRSEGAGGRIAGTDREAAEAGQDSPCGIERGEAEADRSGAQGRSTLSACRTSTT